jgi:hypothetical protein
MAKPKKTPLVVNYLPFIDPATCKNRFTKERTFYQLIEICALHET